jgi:hypothetical protein
VCHGKANKDSFHKRTAADGLFRVVKGTDMATSLPILLGEVRLRSLLMWSVRTLKSEQLHSKTELFGV